MLQGALEKGEDISHLVPRKVADYIREQGLYTSGI